MCRYIAIEMQLTNFISRMRNALGAQVVQQISAMQLVISDSIIRFDIIVIDRSASLSTNFVFTKSVSKNTRILFSHSDL